jgi:FlaA1/EpsC-like NDP-sugar epimerase
MPSICIQDLAEVMMTELAPRYGHDSKEIKIEYIGSKPGEKLYEELINHEEVRRSMELERYFVVMSAFSCLYRRLEYDYPEIVSRQIEEPYNSKNQPSLSKQELLTFLKENKLLEEPAEERPAERYWP